MQETWIPTLGWEDSLEKEVATHSSTLSWEVPETEEPGGYSSWDHQELDIIDYRHACAHTTEAPAAGS